MKHTLTLLTTLLHAPLAALRADEPPKPTVKVTQELRKGREDDPVLHVSFDGDRR